MASDNKVLWILVVILVIAALFFLCNQGQNTSFLDKLKQNLGLRQESASAEVKGEVKATAEVKVAPTFSKRSVHQRANMLEVQHQDPLLVTLFSHEVQALPDGMSNSQFEKLVSEYQLKNLTERKLVIPRSLGFNYERY